MKLKFLDSWIDRRKNTAIAYSEAFKDQTHFTIPYVPDWAEHVWHLYVINTKNRDSLQSYLSKNGIETIIHYPIPPHLQDAYRNTLPQSTNLHVTEDLARNILSLPIGPHLTEKQSQYIIECLNKALI